MTLFGHNYVIIVPTTIAGGEFLSFLRITVLLGGLSSLYGTVGQL